MILGPDGRQWITPPPDSGGTIGRDRGTDWEDVIVTLIFAAMALVLIVLGVLAFWAH